MSAFRHPAPYARRSFLGAARKIWLGRKGRHRTAHTVIPARSDLTTITRLSASWRYVGRMRALAFLPIASGVVFVVAGCGLDQGGLAQGPRSQNPGSEDGAAGTDVTDTRDGDSTYPADTSIPLGESGLPVNVTPPADASQSGDGTPTGCGANTCGAVPSGWTLVAFAGVRSSACPAGFTSQSTDIVQASPSSLASCSCGACTVTSQPTCDSGP